MSTLRLETLTSSRAQTERLEILNDTKDNIDLLSTDSNDTNLPVHSVTPIPVTRTKVSNPPKVPAWMEFLSRQVEDSKQENKFICKTLDDEIYLYENGSFDRQMKKNILVFLAEAWDNITNID